MDVFDGSTPGHATCLVDHVGKGVRLEVCAHMASDLGPDGQQDALSFMVTCPVLMRVAEVSCLDGSINCRDDLGERDVLGGASKEIPTSDAPLGTNEARSFEREEYLLEVGLRQASSFCNVSYRLRAEFIDVECHRQQSTACVVASGGHLHKR